MQPLLSSLRNRRALLLGCGLLCFLITGEQSISGQTPPTSQNSIVAPPQPTEPQRIADALDRVQRDDLGTGIVDAEVYLDEAAKAGPKAIPILEQFFSRSNDPDKKENAASNLVRLGNTNPIYWNFLVTQATAAIDTNPPFPSLFAGQGTSKKPDLPPAFLDWAKSRDLTPETAMEAVALTYPWRIIRLARTGDQRGVPLLRRALASQSIFFQSVAAMGLAAARDHDSIGLILAACKRAPTEDDARFIATALLHFDDPEADRGYHWYNPTEDLKERKRHIGPNPWYRPTNPEGAATLTPTP